MKAKKWVLVTGAASGIGAELCRCFGRGRSNLVLVDKNPDNCEKMRVELIERFGIEAVSLIYDLSLQETPLRIFEELQEKDIQIDVLVNNAGFGTFGNFWEIDAARDQAMVNVNIMAPMLLTKLFLPGMVARRRGRILNVGSVSGFLASPYASTYYSSKAWLLSFSQGVATSLRGTGVTVTVVCPGPTHTAFNWHNQGDGEEPAPRQKFGMEASEVAAQAYSGLNRGQMMVVPGASNQFLALLAKLLPRKFALRLVTLGQRQAN